MATIASLFGGHAPFREIQAHMKIVAECAGYTPALMQALIAGEKTEAKDIAKQIFALEDEADTLKHACRLHLPKRLLLPVDRRDLLDILQFQDTIADRAEDIAGIFLQRDMPMPEPMNELLLALVHKCVEVVEMTSAVIALFDELLAVGFRGRLAKKVEGMVEEINAAEHQADRLERELSRVLFSIESTLDVTSVILWYRVIEWIGDLADYAEKVGNNFRLIIAR
jgi:uncharacterized protein